MISLTEAYERYRAAGGDAPLSRWRSSVRDHHRLELGPGRQLVPSASTTVSAHKISSRWFVDEGDFAAAHNESLLARQEIREISRQYNEEHRLVGELGHAIRTTWGYYIADARFHERVDFHAAYHGRGGSLHRCNACWAIVTYEHNRPECHRCRDWGSCGRDCTRSAMLCEQCGTRAELATT